MIAPKRLRAPLLAFGLTMLVALSFALYTNHVWEDYYITYRSSRNLATGYGLVFNHGDKLHTFTSPLGVLLPALSFLLTGNSSDMGALWIFRFMCAAALGGTAALLLRTALRQNLGVVAGLGLVAWLATDAKTLDFTINGMETAFMLLFLAYAWWAHLTTGPRQWLHLGAAWAGLMWTRPDSFIYVGVIAVGFWLFNDSTNSGVSRRNLVLLYLRAGMLTTALYLPWLAWTTWYYGTPIPHTITAKGGIGAPHTLSGLLITAAQLPYLTWAKSATLDLTFLPSYYMIGGWPQGLVVASRVLATLCSLLWLLPFLSRWTRVASFAFFGAHVYLTYFPYFPFPWYVPSTTLLALLALAGLFSWLHERIPRLGVVAALAGLIFVGNVWCVWQVACEVRAQQQIVENGTRRKIGEWLRVHAATGDTVFMEPLGYIGYFSGLKTYDWPGMSSREMVHARQQVGYAWGAILNLLRPDWIVLRPFEIERVNREAPGLLEKVYAKTEDFDHSAAVAELTVRGLPYLAHDAHFTVFHRRLIPLHDPAELGLKLSNRTLEPVHTHLPDYAYHRKFNDHSVSVTDAPSSFEFNLDDSLSELTGGFGVLDDAWVSKDHTVPVEFTVKLKRPNGAESVLLRRSLNPATRPNDRGFIPFRLSLPQPSAGILQLETKSSTARAAQTGAFWGELEVISLRTALNFEGRLLPTTAASEAKFGFANTEEDGLPCLFAHAPTTLVYKWQPGLNHLTASFGIIRRAYEGEQTTEGVVFLVEIEDASGIRHELFRRHLDPVNHTADRGAQTLDVVIPATPGGRLLLHTLPPPSGRLNKAWSYWRNLKARR